MRAKATPLAGSLQWQPHVTTIDPLRRFSARARAYAAARPTYPPALAALLRDELGLAPRAPIADVGSGTGKLTALLLDAGYRAFGVEPNAEMRAYAEGALADNPSFVSVGGTAQATTLPPASVDAVTAAQAFHWFDPEKARAEWERIVRPGGWAILVWNLRRERATPFMAAYDDLILRFATDMRLAKAERADEEAMLVLYRGRNWEHRMFGHVHPMDLEALRGRVTSSSFMPNDGEARFGEMLGAIDEIFATHARHGRVEFEYDTPVFFGRLNKGTVPP
jgi:SAM-dependent methyltransferase